MVMNARGAEGALRERLPVLWRAIEDAHYSYLETDDSPDKMRQRKKLDGYITEYLLLVPNEYKFGLAETGKVFQRTVNELHDFSAYRAGLGWAALSRYAENLLAQPWRKEYRTIRLYCGYFKHEVEANMVGAEVLLQVMGYKPVRGGRMTLEGPVCPDTVAAVSRDALIAQCECQIMSQMWEAAWRDGGRVSWSEVARSRRSAHPSPPSEIYSNLPSTTANGHQMRLPEVKHNSYPVCNHVSPEESPMEEPIAPMIPASYMVPTANMIPPNMVYPMHHLHPEMAPTLPHCNPVPMMTQYGAVPYLYPIQAPYMIPTTVYAPIKHATTVPINGYPPIAQYRYPAVPTAQLIELDTPSVYENGKYERHTDDRHKKKVQMESSRRNSTSKSGFSDVSLPSLPRSDTQPALSKAREDGMGTYESWDYVFRNLSSKDQGGDRSRHSPSFDRDSRTLDRLDRDERRAKYQPTTLDLEDGLHALNLDRSHDDEVYRTAKVNENLMRMKQEQEVKRAKQIAKRNSIEEKKKRNPEIVENPPSDALIQSKVPVDKIRLLTKKDVKDKKEILKQQSTVNGSPSNADLRKVKKPSKSLSTEMEKTSRKPVENGVHPSAHSSKTVPGTSSNYITQPNQFDLKTHLVVSLDEVDSRSSTRTNRHNGDSDSRSSSSHSKPVPEVNHTGDKIDKWECGTCTYLNRSSLIVCEMCGKSKKGPQIQPLTSGGRECPACTLVNKRDAKVCDACGTNLEHCPTYI